MSKRREARYEQIRRRKVAERTDESTLPFELRAFRRLIENEPMIDHAAWNYEAMHYETEKPTPLWFDAVALVKTGHGRRRTVLIDLVYYKSFDGFGKARRRRKLDYCKERGIPYLELTLDQLATRLRIFCVKVRSGDV